MNKAKTSSKKDVLNSIYEIGKILTSTIEVESVLKLIMEETSKLLDIKNWSLLLLDHSKNELFFELAVGENADKLKNKRLKLDSCVAGWSVLNAKPIMIKDVSKDKRFNSCIDKITGIKTESIICVPLFCRGKILGVIELINKIVSKEFTDNDFEIINHLADYIAIALDNAKNFKKIQELTIKDDLTCLYNTRYFHDVMDREIKRAMRKKRELSLIFMDLDHFKEVNDTYGHIYGSRLLQEVAKIINNSVRSIDIAVRYGGDEFVIVLPETEKSQALAIANRIHSRIKKQIFFKEEKMNIRLTMSIGVANFPDDAKNKEDLIRKSDSAMYHIKNTSRDGVCSWNKKIKENVCILKK